jgi:hypothetical protein
MRTTRKLLVAALVAAAAPAVLAQQGGGGFNFSAFQNFRNQHKYTFQLRTMVTRGLMELERTKSTQLEPAQAKKLLATLTPLRKQPKLTQEQAKTAIKQVQRILNNRQLAAIDRVLTQDQTRMRGMGGQGGPGGMRPGGMGGPGAPGGMRPGGPGGRPGGMRPMFDPARMQNFNPFNPQRTSPSYDREKQANDRLFTFLQARAAGKAAKFDMPRFGPPRGAGAPDGRPGPRPGGPAPR